MEEHYRIFSHMQDRQAEIAKAVAHARLAQAIRQSGGSRNSLGSIRSQVGLYLIKLGQRLSGYQTALAPDTTCEI